MTTIAYENDRLAICFDEDDVTRLPLGVYLRQLEERLLLSVGDLHFVDISRNAAIPINSEIYHDGRPLFRSFALGLDPNHFVDLGFASGRGHPVTPLPGRLLKVTDYRMTPLMTNPTDDQGTYLMLAQLSGIAVCMSEDDLKTTFDAVRGLEALANKPSSTTLDF